jgi:hypothetical protein
MIPNNGYDTINSKDIIDRIEDLEIIVEDAEDGDDITDEEEELEVLMRLQDEASGSPDWMYGENLIRDSYFVEYTQEFAKDIGAIKDNMDWPLNCIDWDKAAEELKVDYISVDFDGIEYWIRG